MNKKLLESLIYQVKKETGGNPESFDAVLAGIKDEMSFEEFTSLVVETAHLTEGKKDDDSDLSYIFQELATIKKWLNNFDIGTEH